jgi:hypothetical protein
MRLKILLLSFLAFAGIICTKGQDTITVSDIDLLYGIIIDGDTILLTSIDEVIVFPEPKFKSKREWRRFHRLVRHVKKVYPYAKMAGEKYDTVAAHLLTLDTEKEKKAYIKQVEKEIHEEFEDDLKKLTITQGRILLKLIDREVGETSYELLKEFKGTFSAFFWQTLARIFGHNLKSEFDPEGEDILLNEIVILIERGQL